MSLDIRDTQGETLQSNSAIPNRCQAAAGCKTELGDDPICCENCNAEICEVHATKHDNWFHCPDCEHKMQTAVVQAGIYLARLLGKMIDGTITAEDAAGQLRGIAERMEDWN